MFHFGRVQEFLYGTRQLYTTSLLFRHSNSCDPERLPISLTQVGLAIVMGRLVRCNATGSPLPYAGFPDLEDHHD